MSFFNFTGIKQPKFQIFTMEYLNIADKTSPQAKQNIALSFTSLGNFEYKNQINVAYEPLENTQFSSDSSQNSPFTINIRASYTPFVTNKTDTAKSLRKQISDVVDQLETYLQNKNLLLLLANYPILVQYENLKLISYDYKLTNEYNGLITNLAFQQIRKTTASYSSVLTATTVANPNNAPPQDDGTVSPNTNNTTLAVS